MKPVEKLFVRLVCLLTIFLAAVLKQVLPDPVENLKGVINRVCTLRSLDKSISDGIGWFTECDLLEVPQTIVFKPAEVDLKRGRV